MSRFLVLAAREPSGLMTRATGAHCRVGMLQSPGQTTCNPPAELDRRHVAAEDDSVEYRSRIVDGSLDLALQAAGAVVIEGPKASGKTETGRQRAASEVRVDTPDARQAFAASPSLLLDGPSPRLLDEWQVEPDLWNYVRHAVDDRRSTGQFILTGSAVPPDDAARHSGAGRFIHLRMRPMTLAELGFSTRDVSLATVLAGGDVRASRPGLTVPDLAERIVVGGWPSNLKLTTPQAMRANAGYLEDIARDDVRRLDGIRRDPLGVRRLLGSLARNIAGAATIEKLTADANGADGGYNSDTIRGYVAALERLMIVDDVLAWRPSIRSRARLRQTAVRHLADPSLATAALNAAPARVLHEINWMGQLFESLVIRDLRVYAASQGGEVFYYRDSNGLEVDAIIELPDGGWAAFEVKLGSSTEVVDAAAANLRRLADNVLVPPVALGVITGSGYGVTRPDGVHQIPIAALAP